VFCLRLSEVIESNLTHLHTDTPRGSDGSVLSHPVLPKICPQPPCSSLDLAINVHFAPSHIRPHLRQSTNLVALPGTV